MCKYRSKLICDVHLRKLSSYYTFRIACIMYRFNPLRSHIEHDFCPFHIFDMIKWSEWDNIPMIGPCTVTLPPRFTRIQDVEQPSYRRDTAALYTQLRRGTDAMQPRLLVVTSDPIFQSPVLTLASAALQPRYSRQRLYHGCTTSVPRVNHG